jgi:anti-anti-sigma factor
MSDAIVDISSDPRDGVDVIRVEGEVDLTNADAVQGAVEATRTPAVVLDLSRVAYLDNSGIRAIDRGHRRLASEQRSLFIVSPPDTAADWTFRVAGFRREMLLGSLDAALASAVERARGG